MRAVKISLVKSLYSRISEEDVEAITDNVLNKAKEGNLKATKMVFDLISQNHKGEDILAPVEPVEKIVYIESPAKHQMRLLVAMLVHQNGGRMFVDTIATRLQMTPEQIIGLTDNDWFNSGDSGMLVLSSVGKQHVG